MRGEDLFHLFLNPRKAETPPRAWGRPMLLDLTFFILRNTPTCVGKTIAWIEGDPTVEKHPHVRGEDLSLQLHTLHHQETPPRAWGRH